MDHIAWLRSKLTTEEINELTQIVTPPAMPLVNEGPQNIKITNTGNAIVEYASVCPFNSINTASLVLYNDKFGIHDVFGNLYSMLPGKIHASSEPRWDRKNPNLFYFIDGNKLCSFNIGEEWNRNAIKVIREFTEYNIGISGKGEGDISEDGNHITLCGDNKEIFLYQFSTNNTLKIPWVLDIESLYTTPDNNVIISGHNEVWLFNVKANKLTQLCASDPHKDVIRDATGNECLIWTNANEAENGCPNGIIKTQLNNLQQTCLLSLGWSKKSGPDSMAVNISCADKNIALISTYGTDPYALYANKLITIDINTKYIKEICSHNSKPLNKYNWQPRGSISRDGTKCLFNSNYGKNIRPEYSEVYLVELT